MHLRNCRLFAPAALLCLLASVAVAQSNNLFNNRTRLAGDNVTAPSATTVGATRDFGEPDHPGASGETIWWEWVAPQSATYTLDTAGSAIDTMLAVYEGTVLNQLRRVVANDNPPGSTRAKVTLTTLAGTAYQIVVAPGASPNGAIVLNIAYAGPSAAPSYTGTDAFNDRPRLAGTAFLGQAEGNSGAARDTGEPEHPTGDGSHWWQWTAPASGNVTVDLRGERIDSVELDTVLNIYAGTEINLLRRVRWNDDAPGTKASRVTFPAAAGQVYQVVASRGESSRGTYRLALNFTPVPGQPDGVVGADDFFRRPRLTGDRALGVTETFGATRQNSEPVHGSPFSETIWWEWIAPANGTLVLDTEGSIVTGTTPLDTFLAVYRGTEIDKLAPASSNHSNNDAPGRVTSRVSLAVTAGTAHQIVVTRWGSSNGNVTLALDFTPTPVETGRLANLSVRTAAGTGAQTLIAGFVLGGSGARQLLIRTVGPTLADFGVAGALADPLLSVQKAGALFATNDNWGGAADLSAVFVSVGAFPLPAASRDAALTARFASDSYTAQADGVGGATGIVLLEAYDAGGDATARLINVSTRTQVGTGGGILIAGISIAGGPRTVVIRAIGPALGAFGVTGVLSDPRLDLYDSRQAIIAANDNWDTALAETFAQVGAFALPARSFDAALRVTLQPGSYTAQVSGVGGRTGVALVEVYEVP